MRRPGCGGSGPDFIGSLSSDGRGIRSWNFRCGFTELLVTSRLAFWAAKDGRSGSGWHRTVRYGAGLQLKYSRSAPLLCHLLLLFFPGSDSRSRTSSQQSWPNFSFFHHKSELPCVLCSNPEMLTGTFPRKTPYCPTMHEPSGPLSPAGSPPSESDACAAGMDRSASLDGPGCVRRPWNSSRRPLKLHGSELKLRRKVAPRRSNSPNGRRFLIRAK